VAAVGAVVAVIWGWGAAQYPALLPGELTIEAGAGASGALTALIVVFASALVLVVPALALLYWLSQRRLLED
jgi:cytochrome d ubiquinol oxidase subunit II